MNIQGEPARRSHLVGFHADERVTRARPHGGEADDAEHDLRLNPTDATARRRLEAIYALAGRTWAQVQELRDRHAVIRYDRDADASAGRAYRQALG